MTTLQTCPGKSNLDSQFSYASDAEDDEAEYQYYRHRALGRPPGPLSEQNITDTRGSCLGFAPFSPSSIGCSADASTAFIPAPISIQLDGAPASSAQGFRFGAYPPLPPAQNSLQSCFGANFLSRFSPSNLAAPLFRFGAQADLTPDPNPSHHHSGADSSILNLQISSSLDFRSVPNISAANFFSPPCPQTNKWSANLAGFGSPGRHNFASILTSPLTNYARLL